MSMADRPLTKYPRALKSATPLAAPGARLLTDPTDRML
jgi:hypothetical protein